MKPDTFAYVCAPFESSAGLPFHKVREYCQHAARQDMAQALLRRCRVLVVCGDTVTEEMESEILLAKRLHIVSTTLAGIQKIALYDGKCRDAE